MAQGSPAVIAIGGVEATLDQVEQALKILSEPGLHIRRVLCKAENPLARSDYHTVAAPHLHLFSDRKASRTRPAFCHALRLALDSLERPLSKGQAQQKTGGTAPAASASASVQRQEVLELLDPQPSSSPLLGEGFAALVTPFLSACSADSSYATAMASAAQLIMTRRRSWEEVKAARREAFAAAAAR